MKRVKLEIADLEEDLVLAEDLYVERRMLMRSGSLEKYRVKNMLVLHLFKAKILFSSTEYVMLSDELRKSLQT